MKTKTLLLGALVALATVSAAMAAGYYTNGFPAVSAAGIQSNFAVPVDTNYAGGSAPQTAYVTTGDLKTYNNGGAIVTASATAGAATADGERVVITSEALTTASQAVYTLTLTDASITAASLMTCSAGNGTNTTVGPTLAGVTPGVGSAVISVRNTHASSALNGTIKVGCRISN